MAVVSRNIALSLLSVFTLSQAGFVVRYQYCVDVFQMQDGSICTTAMTERSPSAEKTPALVSALSCCASNQIEVMKRIVALLKDFTSVEKFYPSLITIDPVIPSLQSSSLRLIDVRHSLSPPLSQLIVQSAVLLI